MAVTINAKGTSSQTFQIGKQGNGTSTIVSPGSEDLQLSPAGSLILDYATFPSADGSASQVLTTDGAGNLTWETVATGGGGINNVVEDTTPQLGGDLDVNGFDIISVASADIDIIPDSGTVNIGAGGPARIASSAGDSLELVSGTGILQLGDANTGSTTIATDVGEDLIFDSGSGTVFFDSTGTTEIASATGEDLSIVSGSGTLVLGASGDVSIASDPGSSLSIESGTGIVSIGSSGASTITTDPNEDLIITSGSDTIQVGSSSAAIISTVGGEDLTFSPGSGTLVLAGTGNASITTQPAESLTIQYAVWPINDGIADQALVTDGAGNLRWETVSNLFELVQDLSPQLGGDLDVNGFDIVSVGGTDIDIIPDSGTLNVGTAGPARIASGVGDSLELVSGTGTLQLGDANTGSTIIATDVGEDLIFDSGSGTVFFGIDSGATIATTDNVDLNLSAGTGNIVLGDSGASTLSTDPGEALTIQSGSGIVTIGSTGASAITTDPGEDLIITSGSDVVQIGSSSESIISSATDLQLQPGSGLVDVDGSLSLNNELELVHTTNPVSFGSLKASYAQFALVNGLQVGVYDAAGNLVQDGSGFGTDIWYGFSTYDASADSGNAVQFDGEGKVRSSGIIIDRPNVPGSGDWPTEIRNEEVIANTEYKTVYEPRRRLGNTASITHSHEFVYSRPNGGSDLKVTVRTDGNVRLEPGVTPANNQDLATKAYVDAQVGGAPTSTYFSENIYDSGTGVTSGNVTLLNAYTGYDQIVVEAYFPSAEDAAAYKSMLIDVSSQLRTNTTYEIAASGTPDTTGNIKFQFTGATTINVTFSNQTAAIRRVTGISYSGDPFP